MLASWIYIWHKIRGKIMSKQIKKVISVFKKKKIGGGFIPDLEEYERVNK